MPAIAIREAVHFISVIVRLVHFSAGLIGSLELFYNEAASGRSSTHLWFTLAAMFHRFSPVL
jgi:hypothetical protein